MNGPLRLRGARAVLVDLDGTLLDTAGDLAAAANATLAEFGLALLPESTVRDFIGRGIAHLLRRCIETSSGAAVEEAFFERALERFGLHYERLNGSAATPYPRAVEGLERMRDAKLPLACVTNKAARFTLPLLERAGVAALFDAVVTSDQVARRKPHPDPFLHACLRLGAAPANAVVIGDSANDAEGARAAGCRVLLVPYGYREGRALSEIDCDGVVATLADAAEALGR
jgi:phosphoglycolate phosphatase